jgi:hypothetical protein
MLCAAMPASVMPARRVARGSVVDAAVAIGGSDTGRTAIEPVDDAQEMAVSAPAASDIDATVRVRRPQPAFLGLLTLLISDCSL